MYPGRKCFSSFKTSNARILWRMHVGQYAISTLQLFIMAIFSPNGDTKFSWILTVLAKSSVCDNKKKNNNDFLISFRELLFSALSHSFIPLLKRMQSFTADLPLYCIFVSDNCTVLPSHMLCLSLEEIMRRTYSPLPCEWMWPMSKVTSKQQTLNCSCG